LTKDKPFPEVIFSGKTPKREQTISSHPCLKPQHFMRILTRALLPLGKGIILDPFMGSGSTISAAECVGYEAIGIEKDAIYYEQALQTIPKLAALYPRFIGNPLELEPLDSPQITDKDQLLLIQMAG
jgi:site-specific DNA-methyltransferase (adenine-specific)